MKYVCIKAYPGVELGRKSNGTFFGVRLGDNPEYWKEIDEENGHEVLSIRGKSTENTYYKRGKLFVSSCENIIRNFDTYPEGTGCEIASVKRLSDGAIFTLGDEITWGQDRDSGFSAIIKKFNLEHGCLTMEAGNYDDVELGYLNFRCVENKFGVLFTTEDGVDIYHGDEYCSVQVSNLYTTGLCNAGGTEPSDYNPTMYRYFSTEAAADQFIKVERKKRVCDKHCLSINDVKKVYKNMGITNQTKLEQIVNAK